MIFVLALIFVNHNYMKSVINLVQTPQGYSIVQNGAEINKPSKAKEKSYSLAKKYVQQTFTIYPNIPTKDIEGRKYLLLPARTLWFNLNTVHEIQKKALPEWFKIKKGILATMNNIKFEKHQDLYKKYRNHIIELGKAKYISPSQSRKGLAGDACAIIRIHKFLQKWGLINYIHKKDVIPSSKSSKSITKIETQPSKRKDCFDRDKLIAPRSYGKDDLQLLKKITKKMRPLCHFCQGICGVMWFEFKDNIDLKKIVNKANKQGKIIEKKQQKTQYKMIVCASCFYQGSYPLVLTGADFVKKTVVDSFPEDNGAEGDKKRNNIQNKIAESIEKNKFNISKTADQVKMSQEQVYKFLMTMPIQKLEKISRIEADTDVQVENISEDQKIGEKEQVKQNIEQKPREKVLFEQFKGEIQSLDNKEKQAYELFYQSWFLKINAKLQRLKQWEEGVKGKFEGSLRLQKSMMAQKLQALSREFEDCPS